MYEIDTGIVLGTAQYLGLRDNNFGDDGTKADVGIVCSIVYEPPQPLRCFILSLLRLERKSRSETHEEAFCD